MIANLDSTLQGAEDQRLVTKALLIIQEYGAELLSSPPSYLKELAARPCDDPGPNILCEIWDKYRFIPTAEFVDVHIAKGSMQPNAALERLINSFSDN